MVPIDRAVERHYVKVNEDDLMKAGKMAQLSGRKSLLDSIELSYMLDTAEAEELVPFLTLLGTFPLKSLKTNTAGFLYIYGIPAKADDIMQERHSKLGEMHTFAPFYSRVKRLALNNKMLVDAKVFVHYVPGELYIASVELDITREDKNEESGKASS